MGSPLTVLSYSGEIGNSTVGQTFEMYFKYAAGNIKVSIKDDSGLAWQPVR